MCRKKEKQFDCNGGMMKQFMIHKIMMLSDAVMILSHVLMMLTHVIMMLSQLTVFSYLFLGQLKVFHLSNLSLSISIFTNFILI